MTAPSSSFFPRRLEYVALEEIPVALRNPKEHDLPGIVASIQEHGFADVLLFDERTQRIVAGHGRTAGLVHMKAAGDPMPEGLVLNDGGEWCVPMVRGWASKSDAHAEAYIVAHNQLTIAGGWNDRMLTEILHDVHAFDPGLFDGIGMTADEMDDLFRTVDPERFDQDPDALPSGAGGGGDGEDPDDAAGRKAPPSYVECPMCYHQFDPTRTANAT